MEQGKIEDLFADRSEKQVEFDFRNKHFRFTVRELTWNEDNDLISKAIQINPQTKKASFDIARYNREYLIKAVAEPKLDEIVLLKIGREAGKILEDKIIPKMLDALSGEDQKK